MRGEKAVELSLTVLTLGSPPHARGKAPDRQLGCGQRGITPACAGKSRADALVKYHCWDHPRMRGEKTKKDPIIQALDNYTVSDFI